MSFLLNRAASTFGTPAASSSSRTGQTLFSADDEEEEGTGQTGRRTYSRDDDEDDDDELEAAFGDSHRSSGPQHSRNGTGDGSMRDEADDEAQELLGNTSHHQGTSQSDTGLPIASGSGSHSPRPRYSRNNTNTTLGDQSTLSTGGYDFEADPYERMIAAAPSRRDGSSHDLRGNRRNSRRSDRRQRRADRRASRRANTAVAASSFLSMLTSHLPLPARFRQYGLLNSSSNGNSSSTRRGDGNTNADDDDEDDDEDDDDDNWIMPPQSSMPGVFGGGTKNDGVFSNMTAKPGVGRGAREGHDILGGDDEAPEKEIPPVRSHFSAIELGDELICHDFGC